jgi:hypothetical protein
VVVGGDEAHAAQAAGAQGPEEFLQKSSHSVSPTAQPSTSRSPPMVTPVTTTTARETTWPPTRPLRKVASANR